MPTPGDFAPEDEALLKSAGELLDTVRKHFDAQAFHKGLEAIFDVVGAANRYVDETAPWALRKTDPERMATVLYTLAETIRHAALLLQPVMPTSCAKMLDQLAIPDHARSFSYLGADHRLVPGTPLPKPEGVFPRWVAPEETSA